METAILDTLPKTDDIIENNETSGKIRKLERIFSEKAKANTPKKISEHSSLIKMVCTSAGMILSTYISMIINLLGVLMSNIYNTELFDCQVQICLILLYFCELPVNICLLSYFRSYYCKLTVKYLVL